MAYTLDQIKQFAANPQSIPAGGSYGEAGAYSIADMFDTLKQSVKDGKLSLADYQGMADPLAKYGNQVVQNISRGGGKASSAVSGAWNKLNGTYLDGTGKALMPFSKQEYAKLPDAVLPTQDQISQGLFDPTNAPLQRLAPTPTPAANPGMPQSGDNTGTTAAPVTPNSQVGKSPVYSANPNAVPSYGGLSSTNSSASNDAQRVAQEAALQQQLATQSQEGVTAKRQAYLNDLTGLLNQNASKQMSEATPGIYEDLNSRGLLHSSAVGDALATKSKSLQADVANQLAQTGIQGATSDLANDTSIQNQYNAGRNSALQREFSVEDYNKQVQTGKDMGAQYAALKPQTPSTKQQATVAAAPSIAPAAAQLVTKG